MKANKATSKKQSLKNHLLTFIKRNYIYFIMLALVVLRVGLGYALGAYYGVNQECDDLAMFNGLSPWRILNPGEKSLIKDLSFSLFLGLSAITNLPYTIVLSLFWSFVALSVWLAVGKVSKNKWLRLFAFTYVLFLPAAFETWGGLRVYRNSIFVPCTILVFSFAFMLLINLTKNQISRKTIWTAIFTGLFYAFTYYLQEDATWLKACMLAILLADLIIICYRLLNKRTKQKLTLKHAIIWFSICIIPFGVHFVWENIYKGINYACFDVYETNTRTNGELATYVETTYIVESPNRTLLNWSPYDAIAATFEASPTLASHPELLENIRTTGWFEGDIEKHPIIREFFGWVIRTELTRSGLWTSEKDVSDMFRQVNLELSEAFANGTLKKVEGRIQPIKTAYPYTWEEIVASKFPRQIWISLKDAIWLEGYNIGFTYSSDEFDNFRDNKILHMVGDVNNPTSRKRQIGQFIAKIIVWVYRIINTILLLTSLFFIILQLIKLVKNRHHLAKYLKSHVYSLSLALVSFMFFCITLVYSFGISWFFTEEFSRQIFLFYRINMSALLTLAYLPALTAIIIEYTKRKV